MITELKHGAKMAVVGVDKIGLLQKELALFQKETPLNDFASWIVNDLYQFDMPKETRSVIILAVPHWAYGEITFHRNGKAYPLYGNVQAPLDKVQRQLASAIKKMGYTVNAQARLPLKRLAVQSGLAEYGKNNITYVESMGSYLSYMAFSTNMPWEGDSWRDVTVAAQCAGCGICVKNCPTGAISQEHFLIDNQKCLSAMNEDSRDFPHWLPDAAHHTPYDCLKCQAICPMNEDHREVISVSFDEAETQRVLNGRPYKDVSKELKAKINLLGLDRWASIPRNLLKLFALMDQGHVPTL